MKTLTHIKAAKATASITPALDALHSHQRLIDSLTSEAVALDHRIAAFAAEAEAQQPSQDKARSLRAERQRMLGAVALGEASPAALDRLDGDIAKADAAALSADRAQEIALAGVEQLTRRRDGITSRISAENVQTDALRYSAAVEHAATMLQPYRAALIELGERHADLVGSCALADEYASIRSVPPRLYVAGFLERQTTFSAGLPNLPGIVAADWSFDVSAKVAAAKAEARAALNPAASE